VYEADFRQIIQIDIAMNKKEQQAIDFLCSMECDLPLNLGFSGGKDSVVILDLAERAGIKYNAIYANTTVDPPGTISFIKKNYSQVQIMHPEKSFFKLIEELKQLKSKEK
jgi:phosphoadenosine phosphosulfate reductase